MSTNMQLQNGFFGSAACVTLLAENGVVGVYDHPDISQFFDNKDSL